MKKQAYLLIFLMLFNYIAFGIDIYTQILIVVALGSMNLLAGSFVLYVIIKTRRTLRG